MAGLSNSTLWGDCTWAGVVPPYQCLNVSVPMDYTNTSLGNLTIAAVKYPAKKTPVAGTMFFNFGGPGASIFSDVSQYPTALDSIQYQLGLDWELVSWDPRGINHSEPVLQFFDTLQEESAFWNSAYLPGGYYSHPPLWTDSDVSYYLNLAPGKDTLMASLNQIAVTRNGDKLKYIGTVANTRDLVTMADLINGPNSTVSFYGYSYGTLLGTFLTQLYPDRVGKVILDGVVDPYAMTSIQPYLGLYSELPDSEAVWKGFLSACGRAGPSTCSYADATGEDGSIIQTKFERLIRRISDQYTGIWDPPETVLGNVFSLLYSPDVWFYLGDYLSCLEEFYPATGVQNKVEAPVDQLYGPPNFKLRGMHGLGSMFAARNRKRLYPGEFNTGCRIGGGGGISFYILLSIFCSDTPDTAGETTADVFDQVVNAGRNISHTFGSLDDQRYWCHKWSTRAAERYSGPWNKALKNIALVLGNEADPVTPYRNSKLVASGDYLGSNARLVQRWDFGHCSSSENSTCIDHLLWNYTHGIILDDKGNDNADFICSTTDSLLGLPNTTHFDPNTTDDDTTTPGTSDATSTRYLPGVNGLALLACSFVATAFLLTAHL